MTHSHNSIGVYAGEALAAYGFGEEHPFGPDRFRVFWTRFQKLDLEEQTRVLAPVAGNEEDALAFHSNAYVDLLKARSASGEGFLDSGDTPAFPGILEAALTVVGSVLDGIERILKGEIRRAFVPIAGLHHARRDRAAGFCALNDCGIAIEVLRRRHGIRRIAYVDIDAHHGDGVFYAFEDDPDCCIVDLHEDGRFLYPGTGAASESGRDQARGTKLNLPLPPAADDAAFERLWPRVESFLEQADPQFILFQCGADSLNGDPITDLAFSAASHAHATRALCRIADNHCAGRLLAMGGGGYNRENLAAAWTAVVQAMVQAE